MVLVVVYIGYRFFSIAFTHEVDNQNLQAKSQELYQSQNVVMAKRGQIYDAIGNVLAENASTYTVVAVLDDNQKSYIKKSDVWPVAKELAEALGGKQEDYVKILQKGLKEKKFQVQFGTHGQNLSIDEYKALKKRDIKGIDFTTQPSRLYPNGQFASDLIGYFNRKDDEVKGIAGIELGKNTLLKGKNGIRTTSVDDKDTSVAKKTTAAANGDDIYTTLNMKLQASLETKMDALNSQMKPKEAFAIMIDTQNGDIVAETQRPTFNATTGKGFGDFWPDLLVQQSYEPGSVMKGIMLATAIDTGNWDPNATYQSGTLKIGDEKVTDWNNGQGWGIIPYAWGIAESSNVAMAMTEQKVGAETWEKYIHAFQFLKSTKSGLPGEEAGEMNFRYPIEQANTAFGQGISVTPMQMVQAYTAIAGDGNEIQPHYIKKIVDPNTRKVIYTAKRQKVAKPISKKTAEATRKQLEDVIYSEHGIAPMYAIPDVRTTGKSGTAQVSTGGSYSKPGDNANEIHSWMGMAPADNPRYMMYIVVKQPQDNTQGVSTEMSKVFVPMMQQALQMTAADNKVVVSSSQVVTTPTLKGEATSSAQHEVEANNLVATVVGDGKIVLGQFPQAGIKTLKNQRVILYTGGNVDVPDMHGWSKADVFGWAELADIKINSTGNGFVYAQSVVPGKRLDSGIHELTIEFKTPKE
jgi:penicillin-binding protein 2B